MSEATDMLTIVIKPIKVNGPGRLSESDPPRGTMCSGYAEIRQARYNQTAEEVNDIRCKYSTIRLLFSIKPSSNDQHEAYSKTVQSVIRLYHGYPKPCTL